MNELPQNWNTAPIGILCKLENGRAFKPTDWQTSGIPIVRIQNLNNPAAPYNYFRGQFDDRYVLSGGELLFAWSGTPGTSFGAHVWRGGQAVLNQHIFRVDFDEALLDKRFFRYAINQKLEELIGIAHGGVGLRHVTKGKFENTQVSIPPFAEQKRIADKLDAVLAQVDACRKRLDRVPAILKRFRQAALAAASSGSLTEEWRENGDVVGWKEVNIESVAAEIFDGPFGSNLMSKDYSDSGIRVVRLENIGWLTFLADKQTFISPEKYESLRKHTLQAQDVLFSSFIAEEVRVCLLPDDISRKAINKADCFCIRANANVCLPGFLAIRLACRSTFVSLEEEIHGATRPRINLRQLKEFSFDLPSVIEQTEIVRRVEALFAYADRLEARYVAARNQVGRLTPALLAKAFRGELVGQDPSDEPASLLLKRIHAKREQALSAKRKAVPRPIKRREYPETLDLVPPVLLAAEAQAGYGNTIRQCILGHMKPGSDYSRAEILAALGIAEADWTRTVRQLKEEGMVVQTGERRGTRYRLGTGQCEPPRHPES